MDYNSCSFLFLLTLLGVSTISTSIKKLDLSSLPQSEYYQASQLSDVPYVNAEYFTCAAKKLGNKDVIKWERLNDLIRIDGCHFRQQLMISVTKAGINVELGLGVIAETKESLEALDDGAFLVEMLFQSHTSLSGETKNFPWSMPIGDWRRQLSNIINWNARSFEEGMRKRVRRVENLFEEHIVQSSYEKIIS